MDISLNHAELQHRRNDYRYPAVAVSGTLDQLTEVRFDSTGDMEDEICGKLRGAEYSSRIVGYLSVLFWGHYGSASRITNPARAMKRMEMARDGFSQRRAGSVRSIDGVCQLGVQRCAEWIADCARLLDSGRCDEAILASCQLPQMSFAFGSKLCAFLNPSICGVIDSVIAEKNPQFGFSVDGHGFVRNSKQNAGRYQAFCTMLQRKSVELNELGAALRWIDRDGTPRLWRAVDVERALY